VTADRTLGVQDHFLNCARKQKVPLTVYLVNGVKLQGFVMSFDNFCVLLRRDRQLQMIYKHAISTMMPEAPIQLVEPSTEVSNEQLDVSETEAVLA
jgi:host factor-I protein